MDKVADVTIHLWPEEAQAIARKGTVGVKVPSDWIGMKGNEHDVAEGSRYKL